MIVGFGDKWQHIKPPSAPAYATSITELDDGRMLLAGGYGAVMYDGNGWSRVTHEFVLATPCPAAAVDEDGTVWMATRTRGVLRYRGDRWTCLTMDQGLPANECSMIGVGPRGDVWVSTPGGLCRYDGKSFQRVDLPAAMGRQSLQFDGEGRLWLDGIHRCGLDTNPPVAFLEGESTELSLHARGLVTWHGSDAWNRTPADKLLWSYQIDERPWSSYQPESRLVLNGLSSGEHTLRMRARDHDFNESEASAAMSITVIPPFWRRPWFLGIAAVLIAVLTWQSIGLIRQGTALRAANTQLERARSQITERFAEKSAQFRAVCDCSPIGIFVADTSGEVTYLNRHLERIVGKPMESARGYGWVEALHPDDRDRVAQAWEQSIKESQTYRDSGRFVHDDGSIACFDVIADRIESEGELLGYVGAVEDVTERIRAEGDLKESNTKLLQALDQLELAQNQAIKRERLNALGQMAAGVAHDINNALAPLLTYAELLASENEIQGPKREWVELIRLGVSDTAGIVKRLEHFYRQSHNRDYLDAIDLSEVVTQAVELTRPIWQNAARSNGKTIGLSVEAASSPVVDGHPAQLRAVMTNLIFNAVDAIHDQGTVTIRITETPDHAVIEVSDDGVGMTNEERDRCLEPFYTSKPQGSGLGLSECHGVVRQHGGHIEVESTRGVGTRVCVLLPKVGQPQDKLNDTASRPCLPEPFQADATTNIDTAATPAAATARVLYIDDDATVRLSTVALLKSLGISVKTAVDGPSGLQMLEQAGFELVMCDQGLPGMDGMTLLNEVKRRWPELPVVIVSGWSLPEIGDGARPDGFLEKPVAYEDLLAVLQRYLPTNRVA